MQRVVLSTNKGQVAVLVSSHEWLDTLPTIQQTTETTNRIKSLRELLLFRKQRLVQFNLHCGMDFISIDYELQASL